MDLNNGNIITLNDKEKYLIIDNLIYNNEKYLFTNELSNESLTENYYIFKVINTDVKLITTESLLNILIPKFREKLTKTINEHL